MRGGFVLVALAGAVAVGGDVWSDGKEATVWSAGQRAVFGEMRRAVASTGSAHPLADPRLRLGAREILVAVHGDRIYVDEGEAGVSCTAKCALFVEQFRSYARAWADGRCDDGSRAVPRDAALPSVAFLYREASVGCDVDRCDAYHTLVSAKAPLLWNATRGILSPNPYFGPFEAWAAKIAAVEKGAATPMRSRTPRALWRGRVKAPRKADAPERGACDRSALADGTLERLAGMSFALLRPDMFDVGAVVGNETAQKTRKRVDLLVKWVRCDAERRGVALPRGDAGAAALAGAGFVEAEAFPTYRALLALPGASNCSFSRHLNGLWAAGAAVLLWRWRGKPFASPPMYAEWYYAGLEAGVTHLEVSEDTAEAAAASVLDAADADAATRDRVEALGAAARRVHRDFLRPCALVEFYAQLLVALGKSQEPRLGGAAFERALDARKWQAKRTFPLFPPVP